MGFSCLHVRQFDHAVEWLWPVGRLARIAAPCIWAKISVDAFGADAKSRHLFPRGRGRTIVIGDGKAKVMPLAMRDEVDTAGVRDQPSNDTPIAELAAMNARL